MISVLIKFDGTLHRQVAVLVPNVFTFVFLFSSEQDEVCFIWDQCCHLADDGSLSDPKIPPITIIIPVFPKLI